MNKSYIALGTNIEPRADYLNRALNLLENYEEIKTQKKSSIYETEPVGYVNQAHFLNMVISVKTTLSAVQLLDVCQDIERQLGRERTIQNGPRTIDLDILAYNQEVIRTDRLTVPHPRMGDRAFVLVPLIEIAPRLSIPVGDEIYDISDLLDDLPDEDKSGVLKCS